MFAWRVQKPSASVYTNIRTDYMIDQDEFYQEMTEHFRTTRDIVNKVVEKNQRQQKFHYDKRIHQVTFNLGDRVWLYEARAKSTGNEKKISRPYHGPYIITKNFEFTAEIALKLTRFDENQS
jgi:hypothetical protein